MSPPINAMRGSNKIRFILKNFANVDLSLKITKSARSQERIKIKITIILNWQFKQKPEQKFFFKRGWKMDFEVELDSDQKS